MPPRLVWLRARRRLAARLSWLVGIRGAGEGPVDNSAREWTCLSTVNNLLGLDLSCFSVVLIACLLVRRFHLS